MSDLDALKLRINNVIDDWAEEQKESRKVYVAAEDIKAGSTAVFDGLPGESTEEMPERVLPEGKRVVRTKSSGDRVFYLDDEKLTRQWVTNPDILKALGFEMGDVVDLEDDELLKYQMRPALYRAPDADA